MTISNRRLCVCVCVCVCVNVMVKNVIADYLSQIWLKSGAT